MADVLIDGKLFDSESMKEVPMSINKSHDIDITHNGSQFHIEVVRSDGSSWDWYVDSEECDELLSDLHKLSVTADSVDELGTNLNTLLATADSTLQELQDVPDDYYTFVSDVATQVIFFISLIFGLLLFVIFSLPFRK